MKHSILLLTALLAAEPSVAFNRQPAGLWDSIVRKIPGIGNESAQGEQAAKRSGRSAGSDGAEEVSKYGRAYLNESIFDNYTTAVKPNQNVIGEDELTFDLGRALGNQKASMPVLLGPGGVGKSATWEYMQHLIDIEDPRVAHLKGKKIKILNLSKFLGGNGLKGNFEGKVAKLKEEIESRDDIILVFDELAPILKDDDDGAYILNELKSLLARDDKKALLGANMTPDEASRFITDDTIRGRLAMLAKNEPPPEVIRVILQNHANKAAQKFGLWISEDMREVIFKISTTMRLDGVHNPRNAERIFNAIIENALQERRAGIKAYHGLNGQIISLQAEIKLIRDGQTSGTHKYFGPHFTRRLKELEESLEGLQSLKNDYETLLKETKGVRTELTEKIQKRAQLNSEIDVQKKNGGHDVTALEGQLEDVDEDIQKLSRELGNISPLFSSQVDQDQIIQVVATLFRHPDTKAIERLIADDMDTQKLILEAAAKVAGQKRAIQTIVERRIMQQRRLTPGNGAVGFYLLGPSSVGKTYLAQTMADIFTLRNIYTMAMGEDSLATHLGGAHSTMMGPMYAKSVETNSLMTLLVDEIDKGPAETYAVLYDILREGRSKTKNSGQEVSFKETIPIVTSNEVTELDDATKIRLAEAKGDEALEQQILREYITLKAAERGVKIPEGFFNRIHIIFMDNLERDEIRTIADIQLRDKKYLRRMSDRNDMTFEFDDSVVEYVAQRAMSSIGNATGIKTVIEDQISKYINTLVENRSIQKGDVVQFTVVKNDADEPRLMYSVIPWDEATRNNSRQFSVSAYDYPGSITVRDEIATQLKSSINSDFNFGKLGFNSEKIRQFQEIKLDGIQNLIPRWMSSMDDFDEVAVQLKMKLFSQLKQLTASLDAEKLKEASSLNLEFLPGAKGANDLNLRLTIYNQLRAQDGRTHWFYLDNNSQWVIYQRGQPPGGLPMISYPLNGFNTVDNSLANQTRVVPYTIVEHGPGNAHREAVRAGLKEVGELHQVVSKQSIRDALRDSRKLQSGGK